MIFFNEELKTFYLESKSLTYAFKINEYGFLQHLYYGKRIARESLDHVVSHADRGNGVNVAGGTRRDSLNVYLNECPTYGRSDYREAMLAFDFGGVRVGDLCYTSHELLAKKPMLDGMPSVKGGETLKVTLTDALHCARVELFYTVFEDLPVILRHAEIFNDGKSDFTLDRAYSFSVDMDDMNYDIISLPGAHLRERFIERTPARHGVFTVDSKRGITSAQMNCFMGVARKNADEYSGEVYGYNLVYSGDFAFRATVDQDDTLRVMGGVNDYDFSWTLGGGEKFTTPEVVMVYSASGLGEMSRAYHDLYRDYLINERFVRAARPIVINNWEATYFDFNTEKLCAIVDSVQGTGIDTLVLDDGWFGARNHDRCGLGDWFANEEKVDLTAVADYAHSKGMKFGLWFEPEMVNPDSDLYRAHPDWAMHVPDLNACLGRDQLVLDLTRDEVVDYVVKVVGDVLKNHPIDYVKWDLNRTLTENYSAHLGARGKETHHRYVLGFYKLCEALINGFPHIFFEGCASGGCRFDPGVLYYFPQIWTSDDSDAYMRTIIQYGTSICYPLSSQSCHVSVCPNHQSGRVTPFESRAHIAYLGAYGYELDTTKLGKDEIEKITAQVTAYKGVADLILNGDLYRLSSTQDTNLFAEIVVEKDKSRAYLTAMRALCIPNSAEIRIYPKGLDEDAVYEIPELNLTLSGSVIMNAGFIAYFPDGDFTTKTYNFIKK